MNKIITAVQQRFADADLLGHVNNVRLQEYFDLGKMEFYNQVLGEKLDWRAQSLILVSIHQNYAQTRWATASKLRLRQKIGTKVLPSPKVAQLCHRLGHAPAVRWVVAFDFASQQSIVLPDYWRSAVAEYLAE